jgi:hypothetical protein
MTLDECEAEIARLRAKTADRGRWEAAKIPVPDPPAFDLTLALCVAAEFRGPAPHQVCLGHKGDVNVWFAHPDARPRTACVGVRDGGEGLEAVLWVNRCAPQKRGGYFLYRYPPTPAGLTGSLAWVADFLAGGPPTFPPQAGK